MKIPRLINSFYILLSLMLFLLGLIAFLSPARDKFVYGYIEPVILYPDEIPLAAKLDTGAVTSSLSAKDIYIYKKMVKTM